MDIQPRDNSISATRASNGQIRASPRRECSEIAAAALREVLAFRCAARRERRAAGRRREAAP
jgi:hypothetical protein